MSRSVDVLVLGARGMLGSHLAEALRRSKLSRHLHEGERFLDPPSIDRYLEANPASYVLNSIGYLGDDPEEHRWTNGLLPRRIADGCSKAGSTLVHVSTNAVFPPHPTRRWLPSDPVEPRTPYEISKALGEDPRAVVIRTSLIGRSPKGRGLLDALVRGDPVPDTLWNGVTAGAFASWLVRHLEEGSVRPGLVHLHSPEPLAVREMAALLGSSSPLRAPRKGPMLLGGGPPMPPLEAQLREEVGLR